MLVKDGAETGFVLRLRRQRRRAARLPGTVGRQLTPGAGAGWWQGAIAGITGPVLESPPFLNVEASATGRRWLGPTPEHDRIGAAIAQAAGLPEIVGRVLARRGIPAAEAAAHLAPALRDLMPDPSTLRDMDRAAERFVRAVRQGRADRGLRRLRRRWRRLGGAGPDLAARPGARATLYVPDRIEEGYGPNVLAMRRLGADARPHRLRRLRHARATSRSPRPGATCWCSTTTSAGETLPPAFAVVNPNRQDEAARSASVRGGGRAS